MKLLRTIMTTAALASACLLCASPLMAQEATGSSGGSVFLGTHYTGIDESVKKAGEFNRGEEEAMGDIGFHLYGSRNFRHYDLTGQFFDPDQFFLNGKAQIEDQFKFELDVRSFYRQRATDLLANMTVRESGNREGTAPGGKMLTHEDLDPTADYGYNRRSLAASVEYRPRGASWLKLAAAHRTILENGDDQMVSSGHCSSCHLTSQTAKRDNRTHAFTGEIEATTGQSIFGYEFNYRTFKPEGDVAMVMYDSASHPVNGSSGDEFASRLNFEDTLLPYGVLPEVEKMAHALKANVKVGEGNLLARASMSKTKNKTSSIDVSATAGALQYAIRTSPKTSLRARASVRRIENDEVPIDVPLWRDGRAGGGQDFDYVRYSALTRTEAKGEAELQWRPSHQTLVAFLGGYQSIKRDDYPYAGADESTNRFIAQAKVTHRPNVRTSLRLKYRMELTDNPFTSFKGIYETRGNGVLTPNETTGFVYYFQREDLKAVDITNQPTVAHHLDGNITLRPSPKMNATIGAKLTLEKNTDLDSLDYSRTLFAPTGTITLTPDNKWSIYTSYTYQMDESNGPVTVPVMDG